MNLKKSLQVGSKLNFVPRYNKGIIAIDIASDKVALLNKKNDKGYEISGVAAFCFRSMNGKLTWGEISHNAAKIFNVDPILVEKDIVPFVTWLEKKQLVKYGEKSTQRKTKKRATGKLTAPKKKEPSNNIPHKAKVQLRAKKKKSK